MAVQFISFSSDDGNREWALWSHDLCDTGLRANFYTPTEPYLRRHVTVSHKEMTAEAERRERERGYVSFDELSEDAQRYWVESDAAWLTDSILRHIYERQVDASRSSESGEL